MSGASSRVAGLAEAGTAAAACRAVVDHLIEQGLPLPSIYLERGGRLRCQAVRGYWQVFDGMPPEAGVIGSTFRSGRASEIRGVADSRDYLEAAPGVVDEVCVPLVVEGRVAGVVNVESVTGLPPDALTVTAEAAAELAERLAALGGVPPESAAQRLARHGALLAVAQDWRELWAAGCAGAADVTRSSSAAVVLADPRGRLRVAHAKGEIATRLTVVATGEALRAIGQWVASGSSCWTLDDPDGCGFPGSDTLRAAGAAAALVVPLVNGGEGGMNNGFLLVVDETPREPATDVVELLELLGMHLSSCARTLASLAALRRRASRDPLTDLPHHAAYQEAVTAALAEGQTGQQLAVVLIDLDDFKAINDRSGHPAGDKLLQATAQVLSSVLRDGEELYRIGGDEFATLLRVSNPAEACAAAQRLHAAARASLPVTISVGVAVAKPDEETAALVARADAALYRIKRNGRDGAHLAQS